MRVFSRSVSIVAALIFLWIPFFAQGSKPGPVSSQAPGSQASSTSGTPDVKELPWKVLASPLGVLDQDNWPTEINNLAKSDSWPSARAQAEKLIRTTIGIDLSKLAYVIIHIFDYSPAQKNADAWYLFRSNVFKWGDPPWNLGRFRGQRIYGSGTVSFLFVHLNVKAVSLKDAIDDVSMKLEDAQKKYDAAGKRLNPRPEEERALGEAIDKELINEGLNRDYINYIKTLTRANKNFGEPRSEQRRNALQEAIIKNMLIVANPNDPFHPDSIQIGEEGTNNKFEWFGEWGVPSNYGDVHYESAVVKRTPANVANFLNMLKVLGLVAQAGQTYILITREKEVPVVLWGAGRIEQIGLPSDVTIAGYSVAPGTALASDERSTKMLGSSGAYNDEQLYWWDASVGIPVQKFKDLQYSASDNTVVASQVDKQSAYAMFNLMPYPVDLSDPKSNVVPRILFGFPFSSSPWDRLFIGGGIGIPLKPLENFQFFAGVIFDHTKQPATLTAGSSATNAQLQNDLKIRVRHKFTFGINVPIKSVIDKLLK